MLIYKIEDKDYGFIAELSTAPLSNYESDKTVMLQWEKARTKIRDISNCQGLNAILPFNHDPLVFRYKDGYGFIFTNIEGTTLYLASSQPLDNFGEQIN